VVFTRSAVSHVHVRDDAAVVVWQAPSVPGAWSVSEVRFDEVLNPHERAVLLGRTRGGRCTGRR
jgi:hypothetical protein